MAFSMINAREKSLENLLMFFGKSLEISSLLIEKLNVFIDMMTGRKRTQRKERAFVELRAIGFSFDEYECKKKDQEEKN